MSVKRIDVSDTLNTNWNTIEWRFVGHGQKTWIRIVICLDESKSYFNTNIGETMHAETINATKRSWFLPHHTQCFAQVAVSQRRWWHFLWMLRTQKSMSLDLVLQVMLDAYQNARLVQRLVFSWEIWSQQCGALTYHGCRRMLHSLFSPSRTSNVRIIIQPSIYAWRPPTCGC